MALFRVPRNICHLCDRAAGKSGAEAYRFLAKHLSPLRPVN
jgi:hypothetical protein